MYILLSNAHKKKPQTFKTEIKIDRFLSPLFNCRCYYKIGIIFFNGDMIFKLIISVSSGGTHQLLCAGALACEAEWRGWVHCAELCSPMSLYMMKTTCNRLAVLYEALSGVWLSPACSEFSGPFCCTHFASWFFPVWLLLIVIQRAIPMSKKLIDAIVLLGFVFSCYT